MRGFVLAFAIVTGLGIAAPALAATAFEDFETVSPKDVALAALVTAVGTWTPAAGGAGNVFVSSPGYTNFGAGNNPTTTSILTANGDESFELALLFPANSISFDVYLNDFGPATASFYNGATLLGTINYAIASPNFLAGQSFSSSTAITRFAFISTQGGVLNTGLDNVRITSVSAVPEAATWAMMIAGFGLVGGVMRDRRRQFGLSFGRA